MDTELDQYQNFDAPPALLDAGFIRLPHAAAFALRPERYLMRKLTAWEDACILADRIKLLTDGKIWWLFSEVKAILRNAITVEEADRDRVIGAGIESAWADFCSGTTHFRPYQFAAEMIKQHRVFRVPLPTEQAKPDDDRTKDTGGFVAEADGAAAVMRYYDGRMSHVLRLGLCAAYASVGSYFSGA